MFGRESLLPKLAVRTKVVLAFLAALAALQHTKQQLGGGLFPPHCVEQLRIQLLLLLNYLVHHQHIISNSFNSKIIIDEVRNTMCHFSPISDFLDSVLCQTYFLFIAVFFLLVP